MIRILYIDDSADDREIVRFNVARISDDIRIESAASAQEAIQSISREKPDCIVSDLDMPGMNGLELLRTLRNSGNRTPFIFFSCHDYTDLRELAILAGAQAFEVKGLGRAPIAHLVETIKQAIEQEKDAARRSASRGEPGSLALSTWT
jgi:CheY-like chemotaxis protein